MSVTVQLTYDMSKALGLRRFDVASFQLSVSSYEPEAAYVLGWLDGPKLSVPALPDPCR